MEPIRCEKCGASYASDLPQCPHCAPESPAAQQTSRGKKTLKTVLIALAAVAVVALAAALFLFVLPQNFYNTGAELFAQGQYREAAEAFGKAGGFQDAREQQALALRAQAYADGEAAFAAEDFALAEQCFLEAKDYQDAPQRAAEALCANYYAQGSAFMDQGEYVQAKEAFTQAGTYLDAQDRAVEAASADAYTQGLTLLASKEYEQAAQAFSLAGSYSDAPEKMGEAYYCLAKQQSLSGDLSKAAATYAKIPDYKDAAKQVSAIAASYLENGEYSSAAGIYGLLTDSESQCYVSYCEGMQAFVRKDYDTAAKYFQSAGSVADAQEKYHASLYNQAIGLLAQKKFSDAKTLFTQIESYSNSQVLITVCEAEEKIALGYLSGAYDLYQKVPKNLTVEGFDLVTRRAQVEKAKPFANICGKWTPTKNYIESRCHYRFGSRWWNWYHDSVLSGQSATIKCFLKDDGTVRIEGSVTFYRFTNYSTSSSNCRATTTTATFTKDNLTSLPGSIYINSYTTLSCSSRSLGLKYSKRDEGTSNFYYKYNSNVTFGKRSTVY